VQIAVISDTHMPKGARRLPEACVARLQTADLIIHAGDLIALEVINDLRRHAPVKAVQGNADDAAVRAALPVTAIVRAEGARIAVVHDSGARPARAVAISVPRRRRRDLRALAPAASRARRRRLSDLQPGQPD
jgi:putative phosphoesterase